MNDEIVKRAFISSKNFRYGVTIEDEFYSKEDIMKMNIDQCKMLMAMCDDIKDVERVVNYKRATDHLGILESKLNELYLSMNVGKLRW